MTGKQPDDPKKKNDDSNGAANSAAPKPSYEREGDPIGTLKKLLVHLWPAGRTDLKILVIGALVFLALAKIANVTVPWFLKLAVDKLDVDTGVLVAVPISIILAYGFARILSLAFGELRDALFAKVGQNAIRKVALSTFRHLHALSLRFHLERQTGGLSRAIERGTKGIDFLLNFVLFSILPTLLEILLVCGILWAIFDYRYAAVTLTAIVGYIVYTISVTEWRLKFRRQMNKSDSEANTKAIDSLLNFETVKYFSNEEHEASRFDIALASYERAAIRSKVSLSLLNIGQAGIISSGVTLVMLMAGFGVQDGSMTLGDFVLVNTYLIQLYIPLNFLGFVYREIKQSLVDMEFMFNLLDQAAEVEDDPDAKPLVLSGGEVSFDAVAFSYKEDRQILKDVSFTVPTGTTTAIVGPSGSGKSTIGRLLYRFYDINSGAIRIDGQDLRNVQQRTLRSQIGIVPQDTVLFNDTIGYNIAYGRPGASESEVVEAARLAQIHDFILSLPEGYETRVGERGLKLSGGERQRVSIARTILKNPEILLFDEATSALDSRTEKEIQNSLAVVSKDRTTLVIAHRLSTIIESDEILVLDEGKIVERGTHGELLKAKKVYAEMWERQQEGQEAA
jgi:ABC-type transport system involved in Fe-S cluster assembly fused permease/ATPase subunit